MTSEPDGNPGRRPPTIDLKATEVDKPPSSKGSPEPPPDQTAASAAAAPRLKSHAVSAAVGAIAMAAIVAVLWIKGFIPVRQSPATVDSTKSAAAAPSDGLAPATAPVASNLATPESVSPAPATPTVSPSPVAPPSNTDSDARLKSLSDTVVALGHRVDDIAATAQSAVKSADSAQTAADAAKKTAQSDVQKADIDALAQRINALENAVKTLSDSVARPASGADDQAARLTIAAEALRSAVERGAPYQAELAAIQALGVDQAMTAPLAPYAASGVPDAASLGHELAALLPALEHASNIRGDGGFLGRLEASAHNLVRITPVEAPIGNDPSTVIGRLSLDAAHADINAALTDIIALPDAARPAAADWIAKAQARNAAIAASRQIAADALTALSKPASQ